MKISEQRLNEARRQCRSTPRMSGVLSPQICSSISGRETLHCSSAHCPLQVSKHRLHIVRSSFARRGRRVLGVVCMVIGAANAFLPLLPTTIFWIVAAWAFSKSSPELSRKLLEHPRFGPALKLWMDHRMMSRRAKYAAIMAIVGCYAITLTVVGLKTVSLLVGFGLSVLAAYLATRREPPSPGALRQLQRLRSGGTTQEPKVDLGSLSATPHGTFRRTLSQRARSRCALTFLRPNLYMQGS